MNNSQEDPISVTTVKRQLIEAGFGDRIAAKKPFLWPQNKKKRLQLAKQHKQLTVDDWKHVLCTNKSKFQIFGSKGRVFVQRKVDERMMKQCVGPSVKHGGCSVMVWDCLVVILLK